MLKRKSGTKPKMGKEEGKRTSAINKLRASGSAPLNIYKGKKARKGK